MQLQGTAGWLVYWVREGSKGKWEERVAPRKIMPDEHATKKIQKT